MRPAQWKGPTQMDDCAGPHEQAWQLRRPRVLNQVTCHDTTEHVSVKTARTPRCRPCHSGWSGCNDLPTTTSRSIDPVREVITAFVCEKHAPNLTPASHAHTTTREFGSAGKQVQRPVEVCPQLPRCWQPQVTRHAHPIPQVLEAAPHSGSCLGL